MTERSEQSTNARIPSRKLLWNGRTIALVLVVVVVVITCIVFFTSKRSIYDELEITVAIIAFALFLFLSYGLYNGATIIGKPVFPKLKVADISFLDVVTDLPDVDIGDGITGIIASIILWILLTIAVFVLLTFVFTVLWSAFLVLAFILYWLFFRALRLMFLKSPICKCDLGLSLQYSLGYSLLYTGWIFGVISMSRYFSTRG